MNSLYWLIGIYIFFMLTTLALAVFVFPFRKILINRWKLKILGMTKEVTPVLIVYKNNSMQEVIIDTSKETFTHDEAAYNIRPNKFYKFNTFWYSIYLHNSPEPLDLQIDEKGVVMFETLDIDGKKVIKQIPIQEMFRNPGGEYIAGKIIDGKTYDNLLIRAYNAGMAWMARNSNLVQILMWIVLGVVVIGIGVGYWQGGKTQAICNIAIQNLTTAMRMATTL